MRQSPKEHKVWPLAKREEKTWFDLDLYLRRGTHGLNGGSSLTNLILEKVKLEAEIFYKYHDKYPTATDGQFGSHLEIGWDDIEKAFWNSKVRKRKLDEVFNDSFTLKESMIWLEVLMYLKQYKTWPTAGVDSHWNNFDYCLRGGFRGLKPNNSLFKLILSNVEEAGNKFYQIHKRYPTAADGSFDDQIKIKWRDVEGAFLNYPANRRNLEQIFAGSRDIHEEQIWQHVLDHLKNSGVSSKNFPSIHSGSVIGQSSATWVTYDFALRKGRRGVTAKGGLSTFIASRIKKEAEIFKEKHSRYPSALDGLFGDLKDITWADVEEALLHKGSKKITLKELLVGERIRLTDDMIWLNALDHLAAQKSGEERWPNQSSGQVNQLLGESWGDWDHRLNDGGRGLSGGNSLQKLIAERVQNELIKFYEENQHLPTEQDRKFGIYRKISWGMVICAYFTNQKSAKIYAVNKKLFQAIDPLYQPPPMLYNLNENQLEIWPHSHHILTIHSIALRPLPA